MGMQVMVIEYGRSMLGLGDANSSEFDKLTEHPVIDLMPEQTNLVETGGTMRLGLYPCDIQPKTLAAGLYQTDHIQERHRHRYEVNNDYRALYEQSGMVFSGLSPDRVLVEIAELKEHPFMIGCQFHPEFLSRPTAPHPLFSGFIAAVCTQRGLQIEEDSLTS